MNPDNSRERWFTLALIGAAVALRVALRDAPMFSIDEAFTWTFKSLAPRDILTAAAVENHPPLFYMLMHFWTLVPFLNSPENARLFGVLVQAAALVFFIPVARRAAGETTARLAAVLLMLTPFGFNLSLELRYAPLTLFWFSLLMWLALKLWDDKDGGAGPLNKRRAAAWIAGTGLAAAALAFSFYIGILCLAGMSAYMLPGFFRRGESRGRALYWIAAMCVALILFLPWFASAAGQAGRLLEFAGVRNLTQHLSRMPVGGILRVFWYLDGVPWLPAIAAIQYVWFAAWSALALIGLMALRRGTAVRLWFFTAGFSIFLNWALMLCFGLYMFPKYHYMFAGMYYLCVAAGIERVAGRRAGYAAGVALAAVALGFYMASVNQKLDTRDIIHRLNAETRKGDVILLNPVYRDVFFNIYYSGKAELLPVPDSSYSPLVPYANSPKIDGPALERLRGIIRRLPHRSRVYAFYSPGVGTRTDPHARLLALLKRELVPDDSVEFRISDHFPGEAGILLRFHKN